MRKDLDIHYVLRDNAKKLGCRWDPEERTWYHPDYKSLSKYDKTKLRNLEDESAEIWADEQCDASEFDIDFYD